MRRWRSGWLFCFAWGFLFACSSDGGGGGGGTSKCLAGQQVACDCVDGGKGVQICGADGVFGPCSCVTGQAGSSHGGAQTSAGTGSGGASGHATAGSSNGGGGVSGGNGGGTSTGGASCETQAIRDICMKRDNAPCKKGGTMTLQGCIDASAKNRCDYSAKCVAQVDALDACTNMGSIQCFMDYAFLANVDCRVQGRAYEACMNQVWSCQDSATSCDCQKLPTSFGSTCKVKATDGCCFTNLYDNSCTCETSPALCDNLSQIPGEFAVSQCPPPP